MYNENVNNIAIETIAVDQAFLDKKNTISLDLILNFQSDFDNSNTVIGSNNIFF